MIVEMLLQQYHRPQIQNSRRRKSECCLSHWPQGQHTYIIAARVWQVLSHQSYFQSGYVGMRPIALCFCLTNLFALQNYKRSPINVSGRTAEFRPPDNRHLVVHECSASGSGEMQAIRDFITTRNHKSRPDSESLHAIW